MTAVFTFKKPLYKIYNFPVDQKQWIKKSIAAAKAVGYDTALYTNCDEFSSGLELDELYYVDDNYHLWDSFKIYVLQHRLEQNYFLCDNDCVFYKKIEFDSVTDIFFDGYEKTTYSPYYLPTINLLKKNKVPTTYNFTSLQKTNIMNIGILKINNSELKKTYIQSWVELCELVKGTEHNYPKIGLTATFSQGLLTLITKDLKCSEKFFTYDSDTVTWGSTNKFYRHYIGQNKVIKTNNLI